MAIVAEAGDDLDVVRTESVDTGAADGPEAVAKNLVEVGTEMLEPEVTTVGLGVPGHFDRDRGTVILFPNLPGEWRGFPLRDEVSKGIGLPTWMINDARAFTLAEGLLGGGKGCDTVACITLGTGIGGGLMIDGKLHRGAFGGAGEFGHQTVVPDGPLCGCGNRGCVEAMARADVLTGLAGRETAADVFAAARDGDERALAAVEQVADFLGIGLANVVTIVGPERIVVGGGIADAGELILKPISDSVKSRVTLVPTDRIEVVPARFGKYAGAVGAALAGLLRP